LNKKKLTEMLKVHSEKVHFFVDFYNNFQLISRVLPTFSELSVKKGFKNGDKVADLY